MQDFYQAVDASQNGQDVPAGGDLRIRVFSVKASHASAFADRIEKLVRQLFKAAAGADGRLTEEGVADSLGLVVPQVLGGLSSMVSQACVAWQGEEYTEGAVFEGRPDLSQLPLHVQTAVVTAWVEQSFAGEKLRPLARLAESLAERATGRKTSISDLLTQFWSPAGTRGSTSTTPTADPSSPTAAGPSPSTAGTSAPS